MTVSIPANTTATVVLPVADPAAVTEERPAGRAGRGREVARQSAGESLFEIGAGEYHFVMPWAK